MASEAPSTGATAAAAAAAAAIQPSPDAVDRERSPSEEGEERDEHSGQEHPPLPDEEPPLPDEQPPLPGEQPPLPDEQTLLPIERPLPDEQPPLPYDEPEDDGWEARQDPTSLSWYFFNRFTGLSQWENPRVPDAVNAGQAPGTGAPGTSAPDIEDAGRNSPPGLYMGYNPRIHGDFDPNADYAQFHVQSEQVATSEAASTAEDQIGVYGQQGSFNRFTGAFQGGLAGKSAEYHNDENKSKRQMNAFFDVDSAANAHEGRSLKAERSGQKLSKKEVKAFNDRRRAKKEQKRRDFLLS